MGGMSRDEDRGTRAGKLCGGTSRYVAMTLVGKMQYRMLRSEAGKQAEPWGRLGRVRFRFRFRSGQVRSGQVEQTVGFFLVRTLQQCSRGCVSGRMDGPNRTCRRVAM